MHGEKNTAVYSHSGLVASSFKLLIWVSSKPQARRARLILKLYAVIELNIRIVFKQSKVMQAAEPISTYPNIIGEQPIFTTCKRLA